MALCAALCSYRAHCLRTARTVFGIVARWRGLVVAGAFGNRLRRGVALYVAADRLGEVLVGRLQIVLLCDARRVAQPLANHVEREVVL
ncbi:hypothetical protein OAS39_00690 [Pirellulales bacterium]|nr:hypothetical protein [Pirellulales bacterium]